MAIMEYDMRGIACELMNNTASHAFNLDYSGGTDYPRIGDTYSDGTTWYVAAGATQYWDPFDLSNPDDWRFTQTSGTSSYDAIMAVEPFRGECLGAIQITILRAAAQAIGSKATFDTLHAVNSFVWGTIVRPFRSTWRASSE